MMAEFTGMSMKASTMPGKRSVYSAPDFENSLTLRPSLITSRR
jgi:hypothetical protein